MMIILAEDELKCMGTGKHIPLMYKSTVSKNYLGAWS